MATRSAPCANIDETVPANDVLGSAADTGSFTARSAQAAIEVAARAAWLNWQIDAQDVNLAEARYQLIGIADDLARFEDRLPEDLLKRVLADFAAAQAASANDDLPAIAAATRQIRLTLEQFHKATV